MSFQDFCHHFKKLEICNLAPDSLDEEELNANSKKKWEVTLESGSWIPRVNAGGCINYISKSFSFLVCACGGWVISSHHLLGDKWVYYLFIYCGQKVTCLQVGGEVNFQVNPLFWCSGVTFSVKSVLVTSRMSPVHNGFYTNHLLWEQRFLVDIKFIFDHFLALITYYKYFGFF